MKLPKSLALLLLIVFPILGFLLGMKYQEIKSGNVSIVDQTLDSNVYTNTKHGFTFKYPKELKIEATVSETTGTYKEHVLIYREHMEFDPGVSVDIINKLSVNSWLDNFKDIYGELQQGIETKTFINSNGVKITEVIGVRGVAESKYAFIDTGNKTIQFYSQPHEFTTILDEILSTFKFTN